MKKTIGILFLCLVLGSCSFNKSTEEEISKGGSDGPRQDFIVDVSSVPVSQDDI